MWIYRQQSGELYSPERQLVGHGYSGFGEGKNNPEKECLRDVGPLPRGMYRIGKPYDTPAHGPHVMALTPMPETNTHGRGGFLIHGDSVQHPGTASHGCIILPRTIREAISYSNDDKLQVVV